MKLLNLKAEIKEILEELENMYEISELEEQVNNINKIRDYIINLQQENKKYKEVIDRAIEYINKNKNKTYAPYGDNEDYDYEVCLNEDEIKDLLEIIGGKDE